MRRTARCAFRKRPAWLGAGALGERGLPVVVHRLDQLRLPGRGRAAGILWVATLLNRDVYLPRLRVTARLRCEFAAALALQHPRLWIGSEVWLVARRARSGRRFIGVRGCPSESGDPAS